MRLLILKDSRIRVKAGETVEVSPAEANFLMSTGSAVPAADLFVPCVQIETPEAEMEIPETRQASAKKITTKTTRKK